MLFCQVGQCIWCEFQCIYKLHFADQVSEGLHLATKITHKHVQWQKAKMKVKLAAQTLSTSVADAITYMELSGHPDFVGASATAEFIRQVFV